MTKIIAARVREQGVSFAVVRVESWVINSQLESNKLISQCRPLFDGVPVVLLGKDSFGRFKYYGRNDIVRFLSNIDPSRLPFREYFIN
ncbi:hypothetical protein [Sutcliffiella halmapala]|uniref:hypothetical protein n=1 Tax=Sutcliffiella halmapala TaxID=79882 RepID=UPI000994A660|nr:hypothetical protein [Sutcliffiella halmapala]